MTFSLRLLACLSIAGLQLAGALGGDFIDTYPPPYRKAKIPGTIHHPGVFMLEDEFYKGQGRVSSFSNDPILLPDDFLCGERPLHMQLIDSLGFSDHRSWLFREIADDIWLEQRWMDLTARLP